MLRVIDLDKGPTEAAREDEAEDGTVGFREVGCCRIRLKPEAPRPCSWSVPVMIGDLHNSDRLVNKKGVDYGQHGQKACEVLVSHRFFAFWLLTARPGLRMKL